MNDDAAKQRSSRESTGGIRAIELIVLAACTFVVVAGFVAFCALVWPDSVVWSWFQLSWWNTDRLSVAGTWFAGIAAAVAIWFSVKIAREAQATSMEALRAQISEESRREQRQAVRDLWMHIRARSDAIDRFMDLWHGYAHSKSVLEGANDLDGIDLNDLQDHYNMALKELHAFQGNALALGASAKDAFLEPMWTVTDEEVRPQLEKLHKAFRQLNAFIEHCYMNLPLIHPLIDSSVGEELVLSRIRDSIVTHSDQLVRTAQNRLSQPNLPLLG